MFCKKKNLVFLILIVILLPSCSILKKDCDCPSFSKIKKDQTHINQYTKYTTNNLI